MLNSGPHFGLLSATRTPAKLKRHAINAPADLTKGLRNDSPRLRISESGAVRAVEVHDQDIYHLADEAAVTTERAVERIRGMLENLQAVAPPSPLPEPPLLKHESPRQGDEGS